MIREKSASMEKTGVMGRESLNPPVDGRRACVIQFALKPRIITSAVGQKAGGRSGRRQSQGLT